MRTTLDEDRMWVGPAGIPYRVQNVQVMNRETGEYEALDLEKTYTLASHNYMLKSQGDGFAMFGAANINLLQDEVMLDNAVLINYIQSMPGGDVETGDRATVHYDHIVEGYEDPRGEGRIVIVSEPEPVETPAPGETDEPIVTDEPAPVETDEPTPGETEPPTPTPPNTGAIAFAGLGIAAIVSGASVVIFKRKND